MRRSFGSGGDFLAFIATRGRRTTALGVVLMLVGGLLAVVVHRAAPGIWLAAVALAGLVAVANGVQALTYARRAEAAWLTIPRRVTLTTIAAEQRRPMAGLHALIVPEATGAAATFRVAWGSVGTARLNRVAATVYGSMETGEIALVACDHGFLLGRVAQTVDAPDAAGREPFGALGRSSEQPSG